MSTRKIESSGSGSEPDLKRRRLLDAGGPVEDYETARQKMREAKVGEDGEITGFDPDNVVDIKRINGLRDNDLFKIKPMGYFAQRGDLPMMRGLYVNGADTRDKEVDFYFPLIRAASFGHIDACKWLFARGAFGDIRRRTKSSSAFFKVNDDLSCLSSTFDDGCNRMVCRWLVLNGALEKKSGGLNAMVMIKDLACTTDDESDHFITGSEERKLLLEWANGLQCARDSFLTFLMGTLSPAEYSPSSLRKLLLKKLESEQATSRLLESLPPKQHWQLWDELLAARAKRQPNNLSLLSGKTGILELVCDYVGIVLVERHVSSDSLWKCSRISSRMWIHFTNLILKKRASGRIINENNCIF